MTNAVTTIRFFGTYLLVVGLGLVAVPEFLGSLFDIPASAHDWLRPLGVALLALAYYYFRAAGANLREFFGWTVHVRVGQFVLFVMLVAMDLISPFILFISAFEFATAVWTWFALQDKVDAHSAS